MSVINDVLKTYDQQLTNKPSVSKKRRRNKKRKKKRKGKR